jgi:hypothetical protein
MTSARGHTRLVSAYYEMQNALFRNQALVLTALGCFAEHLAISILSCRLVQVRF